MGCAGTPQKKLVVMVCRLIFTLLKMVRLPRKRGFSTVFYYIIKGKSMSFKAENFEIHGGRLGRVSYLFCKSIKTPWLAIRKSDF